MNILTFDIEEWFHLLDNDSTRTEKEWENFEVRIYKNVDRILDMLDETGANATFFIIGWIAKKHPEIVKKIAKKHHIGSHTLNHQLIWQQKPEEFEKDLTDSIKLLEDITGKKIDAFRAPGFSIRSSEKWAFEILAKNGITYDCSIFPAKHAHGGMAIDGKIEPFILEYGSAKIKEFPISTKKIFGKNIIFSGGGYFRLCPYFLIKKWSKDNSYNMSYIHPRDLDATQPIIKDLPLTRKFKSYCGLKSSEKKLRKFISDFDFIDILEADKKIDWDSAKTVKLS